MNPVAEVVRLRSPEPSRTVPVDEIALAGRNPVDIAVFPDSEEIAPVIPVIPCGTSTDISSVGVAAVILRCLFITYCGQAAAGNIGVRAYIGCGCGSGSDAVGSAADRSGVGRSCCGPAATAG